MARSAERTPSTSAQATSVPAFTHWTVGVKSTVLPTLIRLMLLKLQDGVPRERVGELLASFGVESKWMRQPTSALVASSLPGTMAPLHSTKNTFTPSLVTGELLFGMKPSEGGAVGAGFGVGFGFGLGAGFGSGLLGVV